MLFLLSMSGGLYAQDVPPTPIVVGVGSPVTQPLLDAVMDTVRPKVIIGWNWGAALRQTNVDLNSNVWHMRSPFSATSRGGDPYYRKPYNELFKTSSSMRLIVAPSRIYDSAAMANIIPWYIPLWVRAGQLNEANRGRLSW